MAVKLKCVAMVLAASLNSLEIFRVANLNLLHLALSREMLLPNTSTHPLLL
jgi:hypothetical protein